MIRRRIVGAKRAVIKGHPWFKAVTNRTVGAFRLSGYDPSLRVYQVSHDPSGAVALNYPSESRVEAIVMTIYNMSGRTRPFILGALARAKAGYLPGQRRYPAKFKFRSL
jgi:hypothetical protein